MIVAHRITRHPDAPAGGGPEHTLVTPTSGLRGEGARTTPAPPPSGGGTGPQKSGPSRPAGSGGGSKEMDHLSGRTVDGYVFEKQLGAGGMGAVFLAHQVSLDRKVALKVLPAKFAYNKDFLVRFTREALSAAQLNHHNIVAVYDVGSAEDLHYIAMEFVRGDSLGNVVRKDGRLQVDVAAGYILQAARGLHYAHEHGIIHRDIKPDNLMINEHGIVKIADMGLAKMQRGAEETAPQLNAPDHIAALKQADGNLTQAKVAMGTPAYMPPEQARDAGSVDHRADQYSLGCTLYYLITGKTPHVGSSAFELISKHMNEPIQPLEAHVRGVPESLDRIVRRMLEKKAENRYPSLLDVVRELEAFLGVETEKGPYTPRENHLAVLETEQRAYYAAPAAAKNKLVVRGFVMTMAVLALVTLFAVDMATAGIFIGLLLLTPTFNFVIHGLKTGDYLFRRTRAVFFKMPLKGWLKLAGGMVLSVAVLWVLDWFFAWIACAAVAAGLAFAYQALVIRPLRTQRAEPIQRTQSMLRDLRVRGVSEEAVQDFVCRFSPANWEEFFEDLFGYEALLQARAKWATLDKANPRKRVATWREPVARWLDGVEEARRHAREKAQMAKVETERLREQGIAEGEANRRGQEAATLILKQGFVKRTAAPPATGGRAAGHDPQVIVRKGGVPLTLWLRLLRAALGIVMLVAWLGGPGGMLPALASIGSIAGGFGYYSWGWGGYWVAGVMATALLLSALSRRTVAPMLVLAGALLILFATPAQAQASPWVITVLALTLAAVGIGGPLLGKVTGGKF